ncbi:MAG TPA: hypothetical protein VHY37_03620 [Tepidisphaeraceae bacterium]|jgi:hypothetical protein|nr:hypothetical protein [Tepidisphaeraceae bacterium]
MRLLSLDRITELPDDMVLRGSWMINLIVFLISGALFTATACLAIGIVPHGALPVAWIWCVAGLFFLWMAASFAALLLGRQNKAWICRSRGDTLWIRCSGEPNGLVLEFNRADLAWAQPLQLIYVHNARGIRRRYEYYHYMDLGLSPAALAGIDAFLRDGKIDKSIRDELVPRAPVFKGWACLARPGVLRVHLTNISPSFPRAARFFAKWTEVAPLRHETMTNE